MSSPSEAEIRRLIGHEPGSFGQPKISDNFPTSVRLCYTFSDKISNERRQ